MRKCWSAAAVYTGHVTSTPSPFGLPDLAKLVQSAPMVLATVRSASVSCESGLEKTNGSSDAWKTPQRSSSSSWQNSEAGPRKLRKLI